MTENTLTEKFTLGKMDIEKAVVTYLHLASICNNRNEITWKRFYECWDKFFSSAVYRDSKQKITQAFKEAHCILDRKSIEEIQEFRDSICIYEGTKVPEDILELALTKTKDLIIQLAPNKNKHLSGFDMVIRYKKGNSHRLNSIPYGLKEETVRKILESMPTKKVIVANEKALMDILQDDNVSIEDQRKAVKAYEAPFATEKFNKFMSRFTVYDCKDKRLTKACVNLCERVHIMNLTNMKPIKYEFCVGSGKRKSTMKRVRSKMKRNGRNRHKNK